MCQTIKPLRHTGYVTCKAENKWKRFLELRKVRLINSVERHLISRLSFYRYDDRQAALESVLILSLIRTIGRWYALYHCIPPLLDTVRFEYAPVVIVVVCVVVVVGVG
jgi:hypothetical protein